MTDRSSGCQGSARPHREDARVIQFETRMAIGRTELVRVRLEGIQPVLRVENMQAALRFHLDFLGFQNANWGTKEFTGVSCDGARLCLCQGGQGSGAWLWIGVDVCRLHEELKARGVAIGLPPANYPWALEMQIEDPDGNVLRLGSEPRDDRARECV